MVFRGENPLDIKIYEVELSVIPKPTSSKMSFKCPARQSLQQNLPIVNNSDKDFAMKATFTEGENGKAFSGPKDLLVKRKSQADYPLMFRPDWMGN